MASSPRGSVYSILGVYSLATPQELRDGMGAYAGYHQTMRNFAEAYSRTVYQVAGIFAALSPVNDYWGNLRSLRSMLEGVQAGYPVEAITVTTTHRNRLNGYKIATGMVDRPREVLKGKKVWNFYNNIAYPDDPNFVTIDRHALSAWLGYKSADGRVADYNAVARDYIRAAKLRGVIPNVLQSTVWFAFKRLFHITYDAHPDFFYIGNNLRTTVTVDEVAPFPPKLSREKAREDDAPALVKQALLSFTAPSSRGGGRTESHPQKRLAQEKSAKR